MAEKITWHIGQEALGNERLDTAPVKAYFSWHRGGKVVDSAEYAKPELEAEIARRKRDGENSEQFEDALRRL